MKKKKVVNLSGMAFFGLAVMADIMFNEGKITKEIAETLGEHMKKIREAKE